VKLAATTILAAILLAATIPAQACTMAPPEQTKHHRDLVADSSQIILARALIPRFAGGELLPAFRSVEVLKGDVASDFVLESGPGLDASTGVSFLIGTHDSDFDGHRDIAFWDQGLTRQWNDSDCMMRPQFEPGETYLLFVDHPHWRAYELVRREDDLWLQAVRNLLADPSRRSGLSVTVPQWLSLAPRAFVVSIADCEKPEFELVQVLRGGNEASYPDFRLQRPTRYHGSRRNCETGMRFLTLVYYQSEAEPDYVNSANFDIIDGMVDFNEAVDGDESELEIVGPRVWSISDLQKQLSVLVER
jgi:hypothetical protein